MNDMFIINELQLIINAKNKTQAEKMVALFNLGVVDALESGLIDLGEAMRCFYSQFRLRELKIYRPEITDIVVAGLELIDIRDIYPERQEELWKEQYQMLREYSEKILKNEQAD